MPSSRAFMASALSFIISTSCHSRASARKRRAIQSCAPFCARQTTANAAGSSVSKPATVSQPTGCALNEPDSRPTTSGRSGSRVLANGGRLSRGSRSEQSLSAASSSAPVMPSRYGSVLHRTRRGRCRIGRKRDGATGQLHRLVLQPEAGGGVGQIAQLMHLLAVALDRCEQFGAGLGVALHAEQHRGVHVLQVRDCRDRARWHGAARPRLCKADRNGQAVSPSRAAGSFASGASAVAASSASIASARRPSRSSRTPRAVSSTGFSGSSSPATSSQASSASSEPAARAASTRCSAYSSV